MSGDTAPHQQRVLPAADLSCLVGLYKAMKFDELEELSRACLEQYPDEGLLWTFLGESLRKQGKNGLSAFRRAANLLPDDAMAHNNLGNALMGLGDFSGAMSSLRRAVEIAPDLAVANNNIGYLLYESECYDEAGEFFRRALLTEPNNPETLFNNGLLQLHQGDLGRGWVGFEYRREAGAAGEPQQFDQPMWLGEFPLAGKTILLYAEQGFGDTLQFLRYAAWVAAEGASIYLAVPQELKSLVSNCPGVIAVFAPGEPLPSFDCHCPLPSLPFVFDTRLDSIPQDIPYLAVAPDSIEQWQKKMGEKGALRAGLAWRGNPTNRVDCRRSVDLDQLAALSYISGVEFFSLQPGIESRIQSADQPWIIDLTADIRDFRDTAALIANLDLVICVDTSVAHLAGAMGKPVWLLNRFNGCWRWLSGRTDSPWYPTMRIFRQPKLGDWTSVVEAVVVALEIAYKKGTLALDFTIEANRPKASLGHTSERTFAEAGLLPKLFQTGRYSEMEIVAFRLLERHPHSGAFWKAYAISLVRQGKDGLDAWQRASILLPREAELHNNLGNALGAHGRFVEAEKSCRQAVLLAPNYAEAHVSLGKVLLALHEPNKAVSSFNRALEINPLLIEARSNLGSALWEASRFDEASKVFQQLIEIEPGCAIWHGHFGHLMRALCRFDDAVISLERAQELDPGNPAWKL